tara:strand:- start:314 stop:577 length:264 start_codon:yes stop_codon:yes gene_type:complete
LSEKIEWAYFSKRRNINLIELIKSGKCQSYEDLCKTCDVYKVIPPTKSEWQVAEAQALPKPATVEKKKPAAKKPTTKKTTRSRKTKS